MSLWPTQLVKICGVRTPDHAQVAAAAGADVIGMIFAPGRRQISVDQAREIVFAVQSGGWSQVRFAGVFVNTPVVEMQMIAANVGLDILQLSGDEPASSIPALAYPIFKALRMTDDAAEVAWHQRATAEPDRVRLLIDAHVPGSYGGAGIQADWHAAATLAKTFPIILAGGLTPASVAEAITTVQPWGVDVSSGVETDGQKDTAKIQAFISAARQAWRSRLTTEVV